MFSVWSNVGMSGWCGDWIWKAHVLWGVCRGPISEVELYWSLCFVPLVLGLPNRCRWGCHSSNHVFGRGRRAVPARCTLFGFRTHNVHTPFFQWWRTDIFPMVAESWTLNFSCMSYFPCRQDNLLVCYMPLQWWFHFRCRPDGLWPIRTTPCAVAN